MTICYHCKVQNSPLWRKGPNGVPLCNACGLYWKTHETFRPLDKMRAPVVRNHDGSSKRSLIGGSGAHTARATAAAAAAAAALAAPGGAAGAAGAGQPGAHTDHAKAPLFGRAGMPPLPILPPSSAFRVRMKVKPPTFRERKAQPLRTSQLPVWPQVPLAPATMVAILGDDSNEYYAAVERSQADADGKFTYTLQWLLPKPGRLANPAATLTRDDFTAGPTMDGAIAPELIRRVVHVPAAVPALDAVEAQLQPISDAATMLTKLATEPVPIQAQ